MKRNSLIGIVIIILVIIGAYFLIRGNYRSPSSTPKAPSIPANTVWIHNYQFTPQTLTVSTGMTVVWENKDTIDYSVTSDAGVFDSGTLSGGKSYQFTFKNPGTFPYHSSLQTYMTGTVIVK